MYDCSKLYLQLQADEVADEALRELRGLISLPAVLLAVSPTQDDKLVSRLVQTIQGLDAAALIKDDIDLTRASGADGVHLSFSPDQMELYKQARDELAAGSIVGTTADISRHGAMIVGEAGTDYIAFEAAAQQIAEGSEEDVQADLLEWWAELFEIPSVALDVTTPDRGRRLADVGADFIGARVDLSNDPARLKDQILSFARSLAPSSE